MTRRQKKREQLAKMLDHYFGSNPSSTQLRAINRRVEKQKRQQFRLKDTK